ncbi:2-hydroxychromene-2-carboxylate isomerase [Lutimaribacter saemankumensis]|uniref:2-hydroxychromene-2-carboxylate isomerase n=1 Tax=Lutimaribacter saemankumensis TaxID=490829 RepID=A0A1G8JEE0_9RHOB|nr:2-hydroxychromene-2-carboxylate isomerase [Lutimaribacter saemankumensis]SDI29639.1 2-hydroxychromene-2-carboxylate isomerase [Lutimaribacter saemankumensis]
MARPLEFWFEFASTYSYLAAMRVQDACAARGVPLVWRPFLLGPVFAAQGLTDSPFNLFPAKGAYMWRDLERECARLGLPLRRPSRFPRGSLLAARIACAHADAPWIGAFVRATYAANFAEDRDIDTDDVIASLLGNIGQDPAPILALAATPAAKSALRAQTETARARGIFGAPSFIVGNELFWGHDRMSQAIDWAAGA